MIRDIYQEEGYALMGAAFEVYNTLRYRMSEEIYQEALEIELELKGIPFEAKRELNCFYKNRPLVKRYVPDLMVLGCLVTELKAVTQLLPEHEAQLLPSNYSPACRLPHQLRS